MTFIQCENKHIKQVTGLYERVVNRLEETINYPKWSESHPGEENIKAYIQAGIQYAYFDDGKMLGAVVLSEDPEGFYEAGEWKQMIKEGEYLVLHILAVDPDAARCGVGSSVVRSCIDFAKKKNYKAIRLDAVPENEPAIRLYEKMGFHYAGTKDLKRNIEGIPEFALYEYIL